MLGNWNQFTRALELRFGPSSFENHQVTLFKLKQTSTVTAYQAEFEWVSNRVIGLSQDALLNCFISGLRMDIQRELSILHPTSLHQTYGLAKLIEDKLNASRTFPSSYTRNNPYSYHSPNRTTNPNATVTPSPPLLPSPTN